MLRIQETTLLVFLVTGAGCGEGGPNFDLASARDPVRIVISRSTCNQISTGRRCTLQVEAFDQNGNPTFHPHIFWTSAKPSVATVDSDGTVTGVAAGQVTIHADTQDPNMSDQVSITVLAAGG